jgi:hypothetical protein
MKRVNEGEGQPAIFYLHPWEVDPDQPRVETSWRSRFRHYNNLDKCEGRLRQLLAEFRFNTARNVLQQLGIMSSDVPHMDGDTSECVIKASQP